MKRYALAILPLLALSTSAFALVGGPFDQNTFGLPGDPSTGTYQGTISGKDITGVMIFGSSATSNGSNASSQTSTFNVFTGQSSIQSTSSVATGLQTTGNEGRVAIFDAVTGVMVIGEMSSVIDVSGRSISGVMEGSRLRSQQTIVNTTTSVSSNNVSDLLFSSSNTTVSTENQTFTFNDVVDIAGSFQSRITGLFPAMAFEGGGQLTITAPTANGQQVVSKEIGRTETSVSGAVGASSTSVLTELVPVLEQRQVDIEVSGVKTSNIAPGFTGGLTVSQSSIIPSGSSNGGSSSSSSSSGG